MQKQITKLFFLQKSKIIALLYVLFSLLYVPFGFAVMIIGGSEMKVNGIVYILMPIIMAILTFIVIETEA